MMVSLVRRQQQQQEPRRPLARRGAVDPLRLVRDFFRDPFAMTPFDWDLSPLREMESLLPGRTFIPDIEVKETKDHYLFQADLPGIRDADLEVSIEGNRLTISGTRQEEEEREEGSQYHVYERSYGFFTRSFMLPEGADLDHVKAELKHGVLLIEIPKKAGMGAKQIPIGGTSMSEMPAQSQAEGQAQAEERREEKAPPKAA